MKVAKNIVEDAKFTFTIMVCSVLVELRLSPTNKRDEERLRQLQIRIQEQGRIIRVINGVKRAHPIKASQNKILHNDRSNSSNYYW